MTTFTGTVERITYYNDENGYSVIRVMPDQTLSGYTARDGTVTVVGTMPELHPGEHVEFTGEWVEDPRYGSQMRVERVAPILPSSREGIMRYLSSGIVKGIGPRRAELIVDHFGDATLDILNREPQRLTEVPQIKTSLAEQLARAWQENAAVRQTMIFLQGYGISIRMANRIYDYYGPATIQRVQADPYLLADDIYGIGFIRADQIARSMGLPEDSPERIRAGLHYALNRLSSDGHTYAPRRLLLDTATELLRIDNPTRLTAVLDGQIAGRKLIADSVEHKGETIEAIYLTSFYHAELDASDKLRTLVNSQSPMQKNAQKRDWPAFLAEIARHNQVELTAQQQSAVQAALQSKVSVLTGGPGTGKTTTLQMVISALEDGKHRYALASPTGRAAKRLSEATNREAFTIHRLLGYSPADGFAYNEDYPLKVDMLIVDEASMIDLWLFNHLLKALPDTCHLMLVGDIDQLPSVGAGNVLRDVIDCGLVYVTRLETIFRQSETSHIVLNAHRVNQGDAPHMDNRSTDFYFFGEDDPFRAAELTVDVVVNRLPDKFGVDPVEEVQVIAPMYRGPSGVDALNRRLQEVLNGSQRLASRKVGERMFRVGDKVMQTRNDYEREIFNGDIGRVYGIDHEENTIIVTIDGRLVYYDFTAADELIHAYCISTHRSQGSEYPVVVLPLLTQHYMMLQRNLLYTAITRARKMVVIVGSRRAVHLAVKNNKVAERYSGLLSRLQHAD